MRVHLDYGRSGMPVELPDSAVRHHLGIAAEPPLADPAAAVRDALAAPIGTASLAALASGKSDACIVLCDITRPVPNAVILGEMLPVLVAAGIPFERITLLIATGTHRPNVGDELVEMLGESVANSGVRIVNHDCEDPETHRVVGLGPGGIPADLDTRWLDASLRITVGLIEPHFMAGYSGGRKLIMPGVAALAAIQAWHSPRFLEHPLATNGVLDGNPVHAENLAIARLAPADLICDVTIDAERRVTGVFAGHMERAWEVGVEFVARQVRPAIPEPVDIVVTCGGGHPLDASFYQVVKGLVTASAICKPGGTIVAAARMAEGIGSAHFRGLLERTEDLDGLVERMSAADWIPVPEQWQVEMLAKAARGRRLVLVTEGASPDEVRRCHLESAQTVETAVEAALARSGVGATL
ncbi:MAG: nickel-dependent lactate racemase, partial [Armatimonadota bacterium]